VSRFSQESHSTQPEAAKGTAPNERGSQRTSCGNRLNPKIARRTASFNLEWEERHRIFHLALIGACGSRWLIDFYATLMDRNTRYRYLAFADGSEPRDVEAEHQAIVVAVLAAGRRPRCRGSQCPSPQDDRQRYGPGNRISEDRPGRLSPPRVVATNHALRLRFLPRFLPSSLRWGPPPAASATSIQFWFRGQAKRSQLWRRQNSSLIATQQLLRVLGSGRLARLSLAQRLTEAPAEAHRIARPCSAERTRLLPE
jgi:hypothetical protein